VHSGDLRAAESELLPLAAGEPANSEASTLLAIVLAKQRRLDEAAELLEGALKCDPESVTALNWLAIVRRTQNRPSDAMKFLERSYRLNPLDPDVLNMLGLCHLTLGKASAAETAFSALIKLQTESAPAHANLGMALRLANRGDEALAEFQAALRLDPGHAQNYLQVFKQLQQLSRLDEGIQALKDGLKAHPRSIELHEALAVAYGRAGQAAEAEQSFRIVAEASPTAAISYAEWLQEQGRFPDSFQVLSDLIELRPRQGVPYRLLAEAGQTELNGRRLLDQVLDILADRQIDEIARMHLSYAAGHLRDQDGDYREAIHSFDQANAIAYGTYPACGTFDPDWTEREPDAVASLYSDEFFADSRSSGLGDPRPVFIVGMIRSGTTLLDQIVSAHPRITSTGEGAFWNAEADAVNARWASARPTPEEIQNLAARYLAATRVGANTDLFTDKMPLNYRHLGMIHAALPNAKILHIRRDAFDTCLSIYTTFFAGGPNFVYRQANIVAFYRSYLRLVEHWRSVLPPDRFFELDYEQLVAEPEPVIRSVIRFLDLEWDDRCLRPDRNTSHVTTPSRWQARQPIYRTSTGKRPKYGQWAPIFDQL